MLNSFFSKQFIIFILTGGLAAAVNFFSRIALNNYFDFSTSIILAYLLGMITAFCLAKLFVFKESQNTIGKSIFYFSAINVLAIIQTWCISMIMLHIILVHLSVTTSYDKELSHAMGVIFPVFTSFIGHKYLTFK